MIVIGVAGGSGSGKTTFARELALALEKTTVTPTRSRGVAPEPTHSVSAVLILEQDSYYRDQSAKFDHDGGSVNFDHPDAVDWAFLVEQLKKLKAGETVARPIYDFVTHRRRTDTVTLQPPSYLILDGILILVPEELRRELNYKVFIETSEDVRFQRRLARDVSERGRTPDGVRAQFETQVKPMHDRYVEPSRQYADYVVTEAGSGDAGIVTTAGENSKFADHIHFVISQIVK